MDTMLYILGVALVVFVFLGDVRRGRRPQAPLGSLAIGDLSRNAVYAVPAHDGPEDLLPRVGTVSVARPELGREAAHRPG